jgi:hypothetical protein
MVATVKSLEAEVLELRQLLNGVVMTADTRHATYQQEFMAIKQEVKSYFDSKPMITPRETQRAKPMPQEWRMSNVRDFLNWRADQVPEKGELGNIAIGDRLKEELGRDCGWAEGQLYLNWCRRMGKQHVAQFWASRGFEGIPEGLFPTE